MPGRRILIVDDEEKLRRLARAYFEADGFSVAEAASGEEALARIDTVKPDLVLLDVMLGGIDGIEVLRRIRTTSAVPVILVTARSDELDTLVGLSVGADDYVTKPFRPRELVARAKAVLRRGGAERDETREPTIGGGGLAVDPARRTAELDGETVELTALEFDLLAALAESPGRVFTRRQLLERVWGPDHYGDERTVDVHVKNLRRALGDPADRPRFVATVRSVGYKFVGGT
ncbi:MAG: response regulator transcription factor [Ilumatobacteraceae bacterium]